MEQLDTQARAVLEKVNQSRSPKVHELSTDEARTVYGKMARLSAPPAEPVGSIEALLCPSLAGDVPVRLYVPSAEACKPAPLVVFIHGGGWVFGGLDDYDPLCRSIVNRSRARVASVGYRLAPEYPFPAALEDVSAVLHWILQHHGALSIDPARIALVGDSAGANLAAVSCQSAATMAPIRALALLYPSTDCTMSLPSHNEFANGYLLTRDSLRWFLARYLPDGIDPRNPRVSPLYGPPARAVAHGLVVTAGHDPLRDEGLRFAEKLRAEGVEVEYDCFEDMIHGFITMGGWIGRADAAISRIASWLNAKLNA